MFAVIKTGGKQYRVVPDDVLEIGKIAGDVGTIVQLGEVLVVGGDTPVLGVPILGPLDSLGAQGASAAVIAIGNNTLRAHLGAAKFLRFALIWVIRLSLRPLGAVPFS